MNLTIQFRCTHCGTILSWDETKCTRCHKNFLSSRGVLDFVNIDEKQIEERNYYDRVYDKQQISGDKQVEDLISFWTNPWHPQDQLVLDSLGDLKGKRVLLIGNGNSKKELYLLTMKPQALVYSDLSLIAVANVKDEFNLSTYADSIRFAALDAQQLPFANESIDVIYGYAIVHHLPDLPIFFSEVIRVLSKGGNSVFMDDAYAPVWHYSKQTFLRPLMKYSHKTSGISPEDFRFSMSGGFREKELSDQIKTAGGVPWFKRSAFFQYFFYRGIEK